MRRRFLLTLLVLAAPPLAGCPTAGGNLQTASLTAFKSGPMIEGVAKAPAKLVEASLIANNGSAVVGTTGAAIVANNTGRYALAALKDEVPLPEAVVYLSDPQDNFYRQNGKPITTSTDRNGVYRFQSGFPRKVPVIVSAVLDGNRRVVGFTVPDDGNSRVNLSVASTYVTEFLREAARSDGKSMLDYDLKQLAALTATTQGLLESGELPVPDLDVASIGNLNRAYAIAVGHDKGGLGDQWASLLGRRVVALETVAGTGEAGLGGDGQTGDKAEFYRPRSAVADRGGHIFVADEGNRKIRRIDATTHVVTSFAGSGRGAFGGDGGPAAEAHLNDPRAVALDTAGNLYIADQLNCRIRRVDAQTGRIETIAGNPVPDGAGGWLGTHSGDGGAAKLARFYAPRALAFDTAGDLYVVDSEKETTFHVIRKIDMKTGVITTVVGTVGAEGAFAGDGGSPAAARLNYPNQIAFDPQGRLLIADTQNHCIRRVDFQARAITTIAGVGGQKGDDPDGKPATQTRIDTPYGVAVAPDGRIFICERGPGRLRTLGPDGKLWTFAGGGTDVRDGEARGVRLIQPHDLFVEATGDLLVADTRGSRLRRVILRHGL